MPSCAICLGSTRGTSEYHPACIRRLFGTGRLPSLNIDLNELYRLAAELAGKMSLSGVQEKISLVLSQNKEELQAVATGGRFILKPEPARFASLPQNEHLTMRLAAVSGIEVPPFGLVRLKDGPLAYVVKRFDRLDDGGKLHVEDFCQLAEAPMRDKYEGSAELCVRVLRTHSSEPLVQIWKLYRLLLFGWWTANGDQHLKNFSIITHRDGFRRLAPAYDLVCTRLVIPRDTLALPVCGKRSNLNVPLWLNFADYCRIPERAARRLLAAQAAVLDRALALIGRSFLPDDAKARYEAIIRENTAVLLA
ncbi:MAG: HipA domain-containing protein [Planctomycetia bacterium]|nr:HipA domain-containing protein [Planctomycetia bacterium]